MDESKIKLGERYRDSITGFEGIAISIHTYIHGCTRVALQTLKDGDIKDFAFDAPALVEIKTEKTVTSKRTGGPRPIPGARRT